MATIDGKKTGGRQKGTLNKRSRELAELISERVGKGYNAIVSMALISMDESVDINNRIICFKEVAKYTYPQLSAVKHTGQNNQTLIQVNMQTINDRSTGKD